MAGSKGGTEVYRYALLSKNVLTPEEQELYELTQLAGITLDPSVFKIVLDLLKLNVAPTAILQMLKSMCGSRRKKTPEGTSAAAPLPASGTRGQEEFKKPKAKTSSRTRPSTHQTSHRSTSHRDGYR